jgi:hypothetical protein
MLLHCKFRCGADFVSIHLISICPGLFGFVVLQMLGSDNTNLICFHIFPTDSVSDIVLNIDMNVDVLGYKY